MKTQYKALKPIGSWVKGQIVGDLPQEKIKQYDPEKRFGFIGSAEGDIFFHIAKFLIIYHNRSYGILDRF